MSRRVGRPALVRTDPFDVVVFIEALNTRSRCENKSDKKLVCAWHPFWYPRVNFAYEVFAISADVVSDIDDLIS